MAEYLTESDSDIAKAIADGEIAVYSGDQTVELSNLSGGENYAVVLGYKSSKSELTGEFNFVTFKVEGPDLRTPYEKWLGTWAVQRGGETDTWTITKNVENSSYKIDGIDNIAAQMSNGASFPIDALFDPATGNLIIHVQTGLATINVNDDACSLDLYGVIEYTGKYYYVTGDYDIVTLKYGDNNTATMEGNVLKLSGLEGDFPILGMRHVYKAEEGAYYVNDDFTPFDQTIRQLTQVDGTGTGGDPGTDPGSNKGYDGWLGNWNFVLSGNTVPVSITQASAGVAYYVEGLCGEDVTIVAGYNSATGALELNGQKVAESVSLGDGIVADILFVGIDTDNDAVSGDPNNDYLLGTGKLSSDGKTATIEGNVFDAVYGGTQYHEVIVSVGILAVTEEELFELDGCPLVDLPLSLSKASSGVSRKAVARFPNAKVSGMAMKSYSSRPVYSYSRKYAVGTKINGLAK